MRLHRNPQIDALLQKYLQEDGSVRLPKEAEEILFELASEDPLKWEDSPLLANPSSENQSSNTHLLPSDK